MLRISKLADYGTAVMVHLAKHAQEVCNARDIALHTHLRVPTVSKILKRLTKAGLLISERGVSGGYRLQRAASSISVFQIIHALEEYRGFTECSLQPNECSLQGVCTIQGNWRLISHAIETALDSCQSRGFCKANFRQLKEIVKQLVSGVSRV